MRRPLIALLALPLLACGHTPSAPRPGSDADPATRARALTRRVPIADGHVDVPYRLYESRAPDGSLTEDVTARTPKGDFDHPRALEGGLTLPFMSIYVPSDKQEEKGAAKAHADLLIDMVEALVRQAPDKFALARSPAEARRNFAEGKVSLPLGIENGAAWNWPPGYAAFLGEMRVRLGAGPTGVAAAENRVVEVHNVFADPALEDWWEVAHELGFAASVSLPLVLGGRPEGAITFYFRHPGTPRAHDRHLLRLVADQLSATAEKAHLIENLQQANALLRVQNVELEARYREAEEARRLKGELLANVSHELRTPLTAILGYAFLLRDAGGLSGDQEAQVGRIEEAGTQLLRLIEDLLDLNNLQLGRMEPRVESCDAVALLRAAMLEVAAPPQLQVRVDAPDAAVPVRTDAVQAVRILRHLVSNAYKFTPEGAVTLRVRMAGGSPWSDQARRTGEARHQVVWEVEDTGIGVREEDLERIFDEFRQADGSTTRTYGGSGLGLAISRRLVELHGGTIVVASEPGIGSTFTVGLCAR